MGKNTRDFLSLILIMWIYTPDLHYYVQFFGMEKKTSKSGTKLLKLGTNIKNCIQNYQIGKNNFNIGNKTSNQVTKGTKMDQNF